MSNSANEGHSAASKHDLAELAIRSAIELERAIAGLPTDRHLINELAIELRAKADPLPGLRPCRLVEPGYLSPLKNVVRRRAQDPTTIEAVQTQVKEIAAELDRFAIHSSDQAAAKRLRDICLSLNRELLQELISEESSGNEWERELSRAAVGVRTT